MDARIYARKKVLLVGDSALMAVTEAALSANPDMEVKRVAEPGDGRVDFDAIIVERRLVDEPILAMARANPGVLILELNWDDSSYSWMLVQKDIALDTEHLSALICGRTAYP